MIHPTYYQNGKLAKPTGFSSMQNWLHDLQGEAATIEKILKTGKAMGRKLSVTSIKGFTKDLANLRELIAALKAQENL